MTHIFTNLEFEYELFEPGGRKLSPAVREHTRRFAHVLRLLPGLSHAPLWQPGTPCDRLVCWGLSPVTRLSEELPALNIVRTVNDKRTSHRLEHELGIALTHSTLVAHPEELQKQVAACPHDWVLKHPFGVSGRERMLNRAGILTDSVSGWARKLFAQGLELVFEPWVTPRNDYSLHYEIDADGTVHYLGRCEMIPDQGGVYRGNLHDPSGAGPKQADQVIERVAQMGYWGPVSLDAFDGELSGEAINRPLVEINARYTFGRLTLELGRWAPKGWAHAWCHPQHPPNLPVPRLPEIPANITEPGCYLLPEFADPQNLTHTLVAFAPDARALLNILESTSTIKPA